MALFAGGGALLLAVGAPVAHATPVLHDAGEGPRASEAVKKAGGSTDTAVDADALRAKGPKVLGEARLRPCVQTPATNLDVDTEYNRAAGAWAHLDEALAIDALDLAVAKLGCLAEPVETALAARVFFLRGVVEAARDRETPAREEFRTALDFDPALAWDDRYAPTGRDWFEAERTNVPDVDLRVAPRGETGPWVDGHAITAGHAAVSPGLHLVQHLIGTRTLTAWAVVGGTAMIVHPGAYPEHPLRLIADPARHDDLCDLLRVSFPSGELWLSSGGWLAKAVVEEEDVTFTVVAEPVPGVEEEGRRKKKK
jgi:hypothetical protein